MYIVMEILFIVHIVTKNLTSDVTDRQRQTGRQTRMDRQADRQTQDDRHACKTSD